MRRAILSTAFTGLAVSAFTPAPLLSPPPRQTELLAATANEFLAQAREKVGMPEPMKLFDDDLLDDMQQVLLTMEKRAKEKSPLSLLEVEELEARFARIMDEMKRNQHLKPSRPLRQTAVAVEEQQQQQQQSAAHSTSVQANNKVIINDEEGPAFDGDGGMGQPRGTVNTYVIQGMDEMSPEEYRNALQQSVIERQKQRRQGGVLGNRSSKDYLSTLGAGTIDAKE